MAHKLITFLIFFLLGIAPSFGLTILIDPGHGGEDHGAEGNHLKIGKNGAKSVNIVHEKDISLSIAKKIHHYLAKDYNSYLTRSIDRTVSLAERASLAEKVKADLFISVHINSSETKSASGFEIYYLDNHKDAAVQKVEDVENKSLKGEELIIQQILTDLVVERTMGKSKSLANEIHRAIARKVQKSFSLSDRGVKPGLFYVLALTKRPAVLLEVGFMSNKEELQKMLSSKFQDIYARAVVSGVKKYIKKNFSSHPSLF